MPRDPATSCTFSCNNRFPTFSTHKAPTVTGCRGFFLSCQPAQSAETQMFPETAPPRHPDPGRLQAPHHPTWLPSHLPTRIKVNQNSEFFPPLESLEQVGIQEPLVECYSLPITATSTAVKMTSWLSQLLCVCTERLPQLLPKPKIALTLSQPGSRYCCGKLGHDKPAPSTSTGLQKTISNHCLPGHQSRSHHALPPTISPWVVVV